MIIVVLKKKEKKKKFYNICVRNKNTSGITEFGRFIKERNSRLRRMTSVPSRIFTVSPRPAKNFNRGLFTAGDNATSSFSSRGGERTEEDREEKCESVLLAFTAGFHVPTFQNS